MRFALGASGALLVVLLFPGCERLASLGPTPEDEGIVFYIHADFADTSQAVNTDVPKD
ncbi:MAG: hypothetical protein ACRD15_14960 [Vicinamibacterales bacterium]